METDKFVLNDHIEKLLLARSLLRKEPSEETRAVIKAINEELAESCWTPEIAADLTAGCRKKETGETPS